MFRAVLLVAMFLLVLGCSHPQPKGDTLSSTPQEEMRPLVKFASEAPVGASETLTDREFGKITVVAREYYYSAAGTWCRLVEVFSGNCEFELVFSRRDDGSWEEIPPLYNCKD